MSHKYEKPLSLEVKPSRTLFYLLLVIFLLCCLSIYLLAIDGLLKLFLCSALLTCFYFQNKRVNHHVQLVWKENHDWLIDIYDKQYKAGLLANSFVSPWLCILNFRLHNQSKKSVIIFPDAIDRQTFRRLRVKLKVLANKAVAHAKIQV